MEKLVTPRKLAGFMELDPNTQLVFDQMLSKIRSVFATNCFLPLDTPVLEYSQVLLAKSGGDLDKEIYRFTKGDSDLAMRYDLTVPLARFIAMNYGTLSFPFKRYQIGKVYRGERPQKGRFREFYQCDADIIGDGALSLVADAECISLICQVFEKLDLKAVVHVSNRNLLFGLVEEVGLEEVREQVLIVLDKIGKIGQDAALEQLENLGIKAQNAQKLIKITQKCGKFSEILAELNKLSQNATFLKGVRELEKVYSYMTAYGLTDDDAVLDLGVIRGQNYYTGTIFEAYIAAHPEFGVVSSGGRYDDLARYYTDKRLPGVGMSIGFTRLFDGLRSANMLPAVERPPVEVLILPLGDTLANCLKIESALRKEGITAQASTEGRSFKASLKDAGKKQIPYVLIVGEDEVKNDKYTLKNMATGEQVQKKLDQLSKIIRG